MKLHEFQNSKPFTFANVVESISEKVKDKQKNDATQVNNIAVLIKYMQSHTDKISRIDEIISYPKQNQQYRIVTQNSFNAFTFVLKFIADFGFLNECILTSYNISQKTLFAIEELINNGKIQHLTLLISESIQFRIPQRYVEIENIFHRNPDKIKVAMIWNHTKIMLAKTKKHHFVVEGSGNLSDNARIEQYIFEDNEEIYKFHKAWIDEIFEKQILKRHKIFKQ